MADNLLIVISGPSGVGKGTIVDALAKDMNITKSISCTTRQKRETEQDGREYYFISKEEFEERIKDGGFLEFSNHFDNFYGTPFSVINQGLAQNDIVLEIDVNGALQVKKSFSEAVLILIAPPTLGELKKRLIGRNSETPEEIESRIERAGFELANFKKYDYIIVNDDLQKALCNVKCIVRAEKLKSQQMKEQMRIILEV